LVRLSVVLLCAALVCACSGAHEEPGRNDPDAALYQAYCAACHLATGTAVPNLRPALAGSDLVNGAPEPLIAWVMYGTRPPAWVDRHYPPVMPPYARLSDTDLATVLTYIRTHFGNAASPVTAQTVGRVRAQPR